jgi:hypothetical protein
MKKPIMIVMLVIALGFMCDGVAVSENALVIDEDGYVGIGADASSTAALSVAADDMNNSAINSNGKITITSDDSGVISSVIGRGSVYGGSFLSCGGEAIGIDVQSWGGGYGQTTGIGVQSWGSGYGDTTGIDVRSLCSGGHGETTVGINVISNGNAINNETFGVCVNATGFSPITYGVQSVAEGSRENNYGIYAEASGATINFAGYFVGDVYGSGNASFESYTDRTPFFEGDALSEIAKISGKDGEIDHSTLPAFAHVQKTVPVFQKTKLKEISASEAFETVSVEKDKVVETYNDDGKLVKSKTQTGVKTVSKGYTAKDGKIVEITEEKPIYVTETVEVARLRSDVYLDEETGKVYQKSGDGQVFEKDGKVYQRSQIGTEVEEQRDIGAMVSMLTVAVQQLQKENEELRAMIKNISSNEQ